MPNWCGLVLAIDVVTNSRPQVASRCTQTRRFSPKWATPDRRPSRYGNFDIIFGPFLFKVCATPRSHSRRMMCSTSRPCTSDAWCSQSDGVARFMSSGLHTGAWRYQAIATESVRDTGKRGHHGNPHRYTTFWTLFLGAFPNYTTRTRRGMYST